MNRLGREGGHSHFSLFLCTIGMLLALVCSLITISVTIDFWAHYIVIDKYYCADTSLLNDLSYLVQIARSPPFLDAMRYIFLYEAMSHSLASQLFFS